MWFRLFFFVETEFVGFWGSSGSGSYPGEEESPEFRVLRRVWQLSTATEQIPVDELEWQLAYPIWSSKPPAPLFDQRPIDVLKR
jgi:hypothetical protein